MRVDKGAVTCKGNLLLEGTIYNLVAIRQPFIFFGLQNLREFGSAFLVKIVLGFKGIEDDLLFEIFPADSGFAGVVFLV